jgi:hypothetical protein
MNTRQQRIEQSKGIARMLVISSTTVVALCMVLLFYAILV